MTKRTIVKVAFALMVAVVANFGMAISNDNVSLMGTQVVEAKSYGERLADDQKREFRNFLRAVTRDRYNSWRRLIRASYRNDGRRHRDCYSDRRVPVQLENGRVERFPEKWVNAYALLEEYTAGGPGEYVIPCNKLKLKNTIIAICESGMTHYAPHVVVNHVRGHFLESVVVTRLAD